MGDLGCRTALPVAAHPAATYRDPSLSQLRGVYAKGSAGFSVATVPLRASMRFDKATPSASLARIEDPASRTDLNV